MNRRRKKAFTLLEVMAATVMIAVLAGSLYSTLHTGFQARRSATESLAPVRSANMAMEFLRQDFDGAVPPNGILKGAFTGQSLVDGAGRPSDAVTFYNAAPAVMEVNFLAGDIQKIELFCQPDPGGTGQLLLRRVTRNLLSPVLLQIEPEVIARNVNAFRLRYYNGVDWEDMWDSTVMDSTLPTAVEITLVMAGNSQRGNAAGPIVRSVILLQCGESIEAQIAGGLE
jgi:prepilin-type N-terminal cleavage/methylation domain-containing protein